MPSRTLPDSATLPRPVARRAAWLALPASLLCLPLTLLAADEPDGARTAPRDVHVLQNRVDEMCARLSLAHPVTVAIVPENPRIVSVESPTRTEGEFRMSFEHAFLDELDEEELSAVIAHELGHVWIFTHHPYLQTEQLANRIAMRVVSRSSLEKVYEKLWARGGTKGDLDRFIGN